MRWIALKKLPPEDLKSDPEFDWALAPTFFRIEEDEKADRLMWSVILLHRHWGTPDDPGTSPPAMFGCRLSNQDEVLRSGVSPEYRCSNCGKDVPKKMVGEKIERLRSLKGVDPRNNRRGAVFATRESNLIDTKES